MKSTLACVIVVYLSLLNTTCDAVAYNEDGSLFLTGLRVLDCYGTIMENTFEEEYTADNTPSRTTGWADYANVSVGDTVRVPNTDNGVNRNPVGRIVYIDPYVERPCFFSAQMGGGNFEGTANTGSGIAMLVDNTTNAAHSLKWNAVAANQAKIADGFVESTQFADTKTISTIVAGSRQHHMAALAHYMIGSSTTAKDANDANANQGCYGGMAGVCATLIAAIGDGSAAHGSAEGNNSLPGHAANILYAPAIAANQGIAAGLTLDVEEDAIDVATAGLAGFPRSMGVCSTLLVSKEADNENTAYQNPNNIGVVLDGNAATGTLTIPQNARLYWQGVFNHMHLPLETTVPIKNASAADVTIANTMACTAAADGSYASGCGARMVNVVLGQYDSVSHSVNGVYDAAVARDGMYVPWAEKADLTNALTTPYMNQYGYAFWIEKMPETVGVNEWSELRAYTKKISGFDEDCSADNCPITIEDPATHEAWVGVSVKNPARADVSNGFYAVLTSINTDAGPNKDKPENITNWYGGLTKIPAGRCRQGSVASPNVCSFGLWHGQQPVSGNTNAVGICNNAHANYNTGADDIKANCALVVCNWPTGRCTSGTDIAQIVGNDSLDRILGVGTSNGVDNNGDPTLSISDAKAWVQINGQGDGLADPSPSNTVGNSIHVYRQENKDIYVEALTGSSNYPAVFQKAISRNTIVANDSFVDARPADTVSWGMEGNVDIKYPASAWYVIGSGQNGSRECAMLNDATPVNWISGAPEDMQSGCGTAYSIGDHTERVADVRIHDWKLNNLHMTFGNSYSFNVMHYTQQFDTPVAMLNDVNSPQKWLMYTQTANALTTFKHTPNGSLIQLTHKPKYVQLAEHAYEYLTYTNGDKFITSVQLGNSSATTGTDSANWYTGSAVRTLIADESRANAADPMLIAEYSLTTAVQFGFHLKNDPENEPLLNTANVFFVNASMYAEDAPLHNGFGGLMGSCKRPTWANTTAKNKYYASGRNDNENFMIGIDDVTNQDCEGLRKPSTPERCFASTQNSTANSLLRGKYELWVQNDPKHFFYKQSNPNATFTVQAYEENDNTFIDGSTLKIGANDSPYEWEYTQTSIKLKYNKSSDASHQSDQVGFVLINTTLIGTYKIPTEVDAREVLYTDGLYKDLIPTECVFPDKSVSAETNVGDGVEIAPCVQLYGLGTYKIFVQPHGSEKFIKQNADFIVKHKSDYEKSDADIVKQVIWRRATLNAAEEADSGVLLFDETRQAVCDTNASKGSLYHKRHDGATSNNDYMQLELTAGSEMKTDDLCYIQILDAENTPIAGPNGAAPSNFMIPRHPWRKAADGAHLPLAVNCQNGPSGASNLTTDKKTGSTNYHQIPAIVVEQFRVGYQLKLWVRRQNAQWTKQTGSLTMLSLQGFEASATSGLITGITKPDDVETLEIPSDGADINFSITSSTTLPSNSDIVTVCVTPNEYGPSAQNTFFRYSTPGNAFCFDGSITPGPKQEHTINFSNSLDKGMAPGTYNVLTNLKDVDDGEELKNLKPCRRWATESVNLTVEWKRDSSMTAGDQIWTAEGVAIDRGGALNYLTSNVVGTGVGDDQQWATEMRIIDQPDTTPTEDMYKFKLRYPSTLYDDATYYFYWTMSVDDSCDCSKTQCTDMTKIENKYLTWPNVGKPNCQEHGAAYDTWFPRAGKYQLCVTKTSTLRGYPVKTTNAVEKTPITLSINPTADGGAAEVTPAPIPGSSSTVTTLFALAVAFIGALIL